MQIKILAEGGSMKPGPALSQKLGPAGINVNEVIQKVNEATKNFEGMKVPVELDVDTSTKQFEIMVFSPPVSELLKNELGVQKGSAQQGKIYVGNLPMERIIFVAKTKLPNLLCKDLRSAVKTVVGSCVSLGILIDNEVASQIEQDIDEGKYDKEIAGEITEVPAEKKEKLETFFSELKVQQDRIIKEQEKEKAEKEAKAKK